MGFPRIIFLCSAFLFLASCDSVGFGGLDDQSRDIPTPVVGIEVDDDLQKEIDEEGGGEEFYPEGAVNIYYIDLVDLDLSLLKKTIQLHFNVETKSNFIFIHFWQPNQVEMQVEDDELLGLFLTSNSQLATSEVNVNGMPFPMDRTATGFFPNYTSGLLLHDSFGAAHMQLWDSGVEALRFAKQLGSVRCYSLTYDSSITENPSFTFDSRFQRPCL